MFKDYLNMPEIVPGTGGGTNDVRVLGTLTLLVLLVLAIVGMDWVSRVKNLTILNSSLLFKTKNCEKLKKIIFQNSYLYFF